MIKYALACPDDHEFEAWFPDSTACEDQLAAGAVECPVCASHDLRKALMAPNIGRKSNARTPAAPSPTSAPLPSDVPSPPAGTTAPEAPALPEEKTGQLVAGPEMTVADSFRKALWEVRHHVESNAEHVGDGFAKEARAIHDGTSEARSIYGDSTEKEAEELREDGIEFARIPWPKHDG